MRLLDRYIAKTVLAAIALVTLMLAGLQIFILLVSQLDDFGKGDYGIVQVALYVLLQMPYQVYLFFPMASLLGCLIGLGIMANHRELVVMRAAGMSIEQVTGAVLKAAMIVIVVVTLIGELLVPRLTSMASDQKAQAISGGQTIKTASGVWLRYKDDFISIGTIMPDNILLQVDQFHFDASHHLRFARRISRIEYQNGVWHAYGIAETVIHDDRTQAYDISEMKWDVALHPNSLNSNASEPDEMTLAALHQYIHDQKMSHQTAFNYQLAYFQRLIQPLTTVVMMVLAIPFIFGPLRSSTMGAKLLAGATVGFGFYIINRFFGPVCLVFLWPAEVAAFGPTGLFALLGIYLMRRFR